MGLHNKKYYPKRRQYIKQSFEVQEKGVRRIDYVFYVVIALPTLWAFVHALVISNFGMAIFFALFFIWWTSLCFRPEIHRLAKKKGWEAVAKLTYDEKTEKRREEAVRREECLNKPIDTDTLVLVKNVTDFEELEVILFDYAELQCESLCENLPLLWKVGENRYAITFPCGVSRQHLYGLADDLVSFLPPETIHVWCRPELFKKSRANGSTFATETTTYSMLFRTTEPSGTSTSMMRCSATRIPPTATRNTRASIGTLSNDLVSIFDTAL